MAARRPMIIYVFFSYRALTGLALDIQSLASQPPSPYLFNLVLKKVLAIYLMGVYNHFCNKIPVWGI